MLKQIFLELTYKCTSHDIYWNDGISLAVDDAENCHKILNMSTTMNYQAISLWVELRKIS